MKYELSKQRVDVDNSLRLLYSVREKLAEDIKTLEAGFKALDEGQDMLNGNGILAQEVRKVMGGKTWKFIEL
jgi:hypothetical protein